MKLNLSITGCMGKMGQQIIKTSLKDKKIKIVSITESKLPKKKIYGLKVEKNSFNTFKKNRRNY